MENTTNKGYYRGRIIRCKNWKALQAAIMTKLSVATVVLYLMWFYEDMVEWTNASGKNLPCMDWLGNQLSTDVV
jgi:hypothetical protein